MRRWRPAPRPQGGSGRLLALLPGRVAEQPLQTPYHHPPPGRRLFRPPRNH
ncbi:UNVERIFIED_CONTAM: hypothetical protein GTU68_050936 [Idotea baltica]|nr:hypothetical protein [Idotea baltica]